MGSCNSTADTSEIECRVEEIVRLGEERRGRWKREEGIQKVEKEEKCLESARKRGVCIEKRS